MRSKLNSNLFSKNTDLVEYSIGLANGSHTDGILDLFLQASENIYQEQHQLVNNTYIDKILIRLWNFKAIEGQFSEQSKYMLLSKSKKCMNMFRRGFGWTVCRRLQKIKKSILRHYLKDFVQDIVRDQVGSRKSFSEDINLMKNQQEKMIDKIINQAIYIPERGTRHEIIIQPFDCVENIINKELGEYLFLQEKIKDDLWMSFKIKFRNALIALFTTLGILELSIFGLIL